MGTQYDGPAGDTQRAGSTTGLSRRVERDDVRSGHPARPDDGNSARRNCRVRARADPGAHSLWHRRGQGARQAAGPPTWAAAKIRPTGAESRGACRKGTELSLDRARGGAEQEYRRRYRQTPPCQGDSDRLTATLHLVTRMLGLDRNLRQARLQWGAGHRPGIGLNPLMGRRMS